MIILVANFSCAKVGYMAEQGVGQISLLTSARDNKWVLEDPETPESVRQKIKAIEEYKQFFEDFWGVSTGQIYTRTTFLETSAVTHLLIASPYDEVQAHVECFPIMGCFPYLGFFYRQSAESWANNLKREGLTTYIRPVYAYSTLGHFNDTILSSFFYYDDFDLAELIFHELFHTMFFPKNEVALNEALATYFGKQMAYIYFDIDENEREDRHEKKRVHAKISKKVVKWVDKLNERYKNRAHKLQKPLSREQSSQILKTFLEEEFKPYFKSYCSSLNITKSRCFPLNREWNNASFAAFLTYQDRITPLVELQESLDVDIKALFRYIEKEYEAYQGFDRQKKSKISFGEYLFNDA